MSDAQLPGVRAALVDPGGTTSRPFYVFFQNQAANLVALSERVGVIESTPSGSSNLSPNANVTGAYSIAVQGTLRTGIARVLLEGDVEFAGATNYYGSDGTGAKGWYAISDALDSTANITLTVGTDGVTKIDLADLADSGTGAALVKITRDSKGRVSGTHSATTSDLAEGTNLYYTNARADARIALQKAQPLGLATLNAGGKLDAGQLPALAITETFVVNTQAAMLALAAEEGDVAVRTDESKSYILTAAPASTVANWQELLTPASPVTSIFGRVGSVTAAAGDYTFVQIGSTPTTLAGYGITDAEPSIAAGTVAQYWRGDKSWHDFATDVRAAVLTGLSLATSAVIAATDTVLGALGKLQAQITDNLLPKGYIDGLAMVWVSSTALTVRSGAAYIEGSSKVLRAAADIAKAGLALTASTWYHVYLYSNAGTPDVEIVTTAPATPYNGTACSKTGDTSRRYVGSVRTDASGNVLSFYHEAATGNVHYRVDLNTTGFKLVSGGTSTTDATVSAAGVIPATARTMLTFSENNAAGGLVFIGNADAGTPANTHILAFIRSVRTLCGELQLTSSQTFSYLVTSPAVFDCYCAGYRYER
jgi:hypothetical protein